MKLQDLSDLKQERVDNVRDCVQGLNDVKQEMANGVSDCVQGLSDVKQEAVDDMSMSDCVSDVHVKQETTDDVSDCISLEMDDEDCENAKSTMKHDKAVCVVVAENAK